MQPDVEKQDYVAWAVLDASKPRHVCLRVQRVQGETGHGPATLTMPPTAGSTATHQVRCGPFCSDCKDAQIRHGGPLPVAVPLPAICANPAQEVLGHVLRHLLQALQPLQAPMHMQAPPPSGRDCENCHTSPCVCHFGGDDAGEVTAGQHPAGQLMSLETRPRQQAPVPVLHCCRPTSTTDGWRASCTLPPPRRNRGSPSKTPFWAADAAFHNPSIGGHHQSIPAHQPHTGPPTLPHRSAQFHQGLHNSVMVCTIPWARVCTIPS